MIVMGFDPGSVSGAWAALYDDDNLAVGDLPMLIGGVDAAALGRVVRIAAPKLAIVEDVHTMKGQGIASSGRFMESKGVILGVLGALGVRTVLVPPQRWKKYFHLDKEKDRSRTLAIRTWPNCEQFGRVRDGGRAEAALMAKYGKDTAA